MTKISIKNKQKNPKKPTVSGACNPSYNKILFVFIINTNIIQRKKKKKKK